MKRQLFYRVANMSQDPPPENSDIVELKETQGQKKFRQYVEDLLRNRVFLSAAKKMLAAYYASKRPEDGELEELLRDYKRLDVRARRFNRTNFGPTDERSDYLADEYGLDDELMRPVMFKLSASSDSDPRLALMYDLLDTDLCITKDNNDDHLNPIFPSIPLAMDRHKQRHWRAFPVSIDIHKFATKRDVLDYIEKRWSWIDSLLAVYRNEKKVKFRSRKYSRKMLDFLWDNRGLGAKELKRRLDTQFPENRLVYFEILKLLSIEKRRRGRKIIVGQ